MTLDVLRASRVLAAVASLLAAVVAAACQGNSEQTRFRESLPAFNDVEMVRIGTYPILEKIPLPFTPEENEARARWILGQLENAPISAAPVDDEGMRVASSISGGVQIVRKDGREAAAVWAAVDCYPQPGGYNCRVDPRDVVVSSGDKAVRVAARELAEWQREGWQAEARMVSQADYERTMEQRFPALQIPEAEPNRMWVRVTPTGAPVPQPLISTVPQDQTTMRRVLDALRLATAGSDSTVAGAYHRFGDATLGLLITFPGDISLGIQPAYVCISDGTNEPCYRTPDEVLVDDYRGFRGPYHLRSPQLAEWLASGYLRDMRMGTYEEYQREAHW